MIVLHNGSINSGKSAVAKLFQKSVRAKGTDKVFSVLRGVASSACEQEESEYNV